MPRTLMPEEVGNHPVFVYGSLKKGFHNHDWLEGADYVGVDCLLNFLMISLGSYPGIIPAPQSGLIVYGELYVVDDATFKRLDRLEGYPNLYTREFVTLCSGRKGWVYIWNGDRDNQLVVESGQWSQKHVCC